MLPDITQRTRPLYGGGSLGKQGKDQDRGSGLMVPERPFAAQVAPVALSGRNTLRQLSSFEGETNEPLTRKRRGKATPSIGFGYADPSPEPV
ncbi:hypothetical protein [Sphingomonas dokdonensis]|uniref:hypothetical protein n=1 Tax=Sphingomonas dokdonensis TaxID=344880 RepID=UPI00146CA947|nr:hypothetical protein [Sphingomonas dokdonensis]